MREGQRETGKRIYSGANMMTKRRTKEDIRKEKERKGRETERRSLRIAPAFSLATAAFNASPKSLGSLGKKGRKEKKQKNKEKELANSTPSCWQQRSSTPPPSPWVVWRSPPGSRDSRLEGRRRGCASSPTRPCAEPSQSLPCSTPPARIRVLCVLSGAHVSTEAFTVSQ